jgi:putative oxidoreductase
MPDTSLYPETIKGHHLSIAPTGAFPQESMMSTTRRIDTAAVLLRTGLGVMFIAHALLKYFVFTLPGTAEFFGSLGLPAQLGYIVFAAELIGGVLLVAGVFTRVVAFALVPVLLGALWAHSGNGWLFTSANGGWEYPAFLALVGVVVGFLGDGATERAGAFGGTRARPQQLAH